MKQEHITLREYVETKFADSEKAVTAALSAQKEAILKAENANEKRFEGVNEFRQTLADQQRTLMPRSESELVTKGITDRLKALEDARIQKTGETGGAKNLWAVIIGIAGFASIVLGLVTYFLNK